MSKVSGREATAERDDAVTKPEPMEVDSSEDQHSSGHSGGMTPDGASVDDPFAANSAAVMSNGSSSSVKATSSEGSPPERLKIMTDRVDEERDSSEELICVCTPVKQPPRPPNSFMLYRKHNHAKVAKENPGLDNPQLSKLIAKIWNSESDGEKARWKARADEGARQHAEQYPGYKYRPKRRGKYSDVSAQPVASDEPCAKCGGLPLVTPRTSIPRTPATGKTRVPLAPAIKEEVDVNGHHDAGQNNIKRSPDEQDRDSSASPSKRRRLPNGAHNRPAQPPHIQTGPYSRPPGQIANTPTGRYVGTPLPNMASLVGSQGGNMPPPPVPTYARGGQRSARSTHGQEWGVELPPLQTRMPMQSPASQSAASQKDGRYGFTPVNDAHPSARSTSEHGELSLKEQVVSKIPIDWKLGVLEHVTPILPRVKQGTNGSEARGAIIALEGPDEMSLELVGEAVERTLRVSGQVGLKGFQNDYRHIETLCSDSEKEVLAETTDVVSHVFQHVASWHDRSKEMVKHVHQTPSGRASVPVALIKGGFSITVADRLAYSTNPTLHFKVADHWRWMVGLFRGIAGPDLTVYAKPSSEEEIRRNGIIDFQRQSRLMIVRVGDKGVDEATDRRISFEIIEWMRDGWIAPETPRA